MKRWCCLITCLKNRNISPGTCRVFRCWNTLKCCLTFHREQRSCPFLTWLEIIFRQSVFYFAIILIIWFSRFVCFAELCFAESVLLQLFSVNSGHCRSPARNEKGGGMNHKNHTGKSRKSRFFQLDLIRLSDSSLTISARSTAEVQPANQVKKYRRIQNLARYLQVEFKIWQDSRKMIQILQESCQQLASSMHSLPRLLARFLQDFEFVDH